MGVGILSCCKNKNEDNIGKDDSFDKNENKKDNLMIKLNKDYKEDRKEDSKIYSGSFNRSSPLKTLNSHAPERAGDDLEIGIAPSKNLNSGTGNVIKLFSLNNIERGLSNNNFSVNPTNNSLNLTVTQDDFKSIKKIIFYFEKFELTYRFYDDFGLIFDPILNFKVNSQFDRTFDQKEKETEEEEDLLKNELSNNDSFTGERSTANMFQNNTNNRFGNNQNNTSSNKEFLFNQYEILDVQDMENWPYKKVKFTILNKSKSQQFNSIQVGFFQIPLMVLLDEGGIEGKFPVRSKITKEVGFLHMRIKCIINEAELDDLQSPAYNLTLKDNELIDTDNPLFTPVNNKIIDYYKNIMTINFNDLDQILQSNFITKKVDVLLKNIKDTEKGWNEKKSRQEQEKELDRINNNPMSPQEISTILFESVLKQQQIMIYGILNYVIIRIGKNDVSFINEFLDIINLNKTKKEIDFFNYFLEIFHSRNLVLIKQFCIFFYKTLELYREIELTTEKSTDKLDSESLFTILLDSMGHLSFLLDSFKDLEYEETEELREIIYWILNIILTLITPNVTDKLIQLDVINKLYSIAFNNCIKLITKPKFVIEIFRHMNSDSEVTALLVKIFRKGIQILLDDKNNFVQHSDKPKIVSNSIKELILIDEKSNSLMMFIQICLTKFFNYPEVFSSILLILIYFCSDLKYPEIIRKILDSIEISLLCTGFDFYRGNLKKIGKNINFFFYKFISSITEINKSFEEEETTVNFKHTEIREVCNEFLKLFRMKQSAKETWEKSRTLVYFIKNKNLDLHEVLCCIAANLTKNTEAFKTISKDRCYFLQHMIEYFFELNRESIKKFLDKYRNNKKEKIALYISIIDNSLQLFDNLISRSPNSKDFFLNFLNSKNLTKNKVKYHITDLLDTASSTLNCNNQKLKKTADNFLNNYD